MRIRAGFVSNSSSTSFLIICKGKFTREQLRTLMGVRKESPMSGLFEQLYDDIMNSVDAEVEMGNLKGQVRWDSILGHRSTKLSERMIEKLESSKRHGWRAYYGHLDSESNSVQTFFCTDSFEEENDEVYLNGLECAW